MIRIKESELILNPDGSIYHLNLKPEDISNTIFFVGVRTELKRLLNILIRLNFLHKNVNLKHKQAPIKEKEFLLFQLELDLTILISF